MNLSIRSYGRVQLLNLAVVICWLLTFAIGYKAFFFQDELFRVLPLDIDSEIMNLTVTSITVLLPLAIFYFDRKKLLFILLLVFYVVFCLLDINRLTPYFFCYLGLFAVISFYWANTVALQKCFLIIAVGIYIVSGIHKFNGHFAENVLKYIWFYSIPFEPSVAAGRLIAGIEILLGIGLLFKKLRKVCCIGLIGLHLILLWKLGPMRLNWNLIVWPWNFAMIAVLLFVFKSKVGINELVPNISIVQGSLIVFFWILPLLSIFNLAPENLGFKLYTGNWYSPNLLIDKKLSEYSEYDLSDQEGQTLINLQSYSMITRHLAINPEPWIFEEIALNFEKKYGVSAKIIPLENEEDQLKR
ncbi:MAG: hypothetical protein WBG46_04780 [Nonlabens sp.]